jgi:hypothetical protein
LPTRTYIKETSLSILQAPAHWLASLRGSDEQQLANQEQASSESSQQETSLYTCLAFHSSQFIHFLKIFFFTIYEVTNTKKLTVKYGVQIWMKAFNLAIFALSIELYFVVDQFIRARYNSFNKR